MDAKRGTRSDMSWGQKKQPDVCREPATERRPAREHKEPARRHREPARKHREPAKKIGHVSKTANRNTEERGSQSEHRHVRRIANQIAGSSFKRIRRASRDFSSVVQTPVHVTQTCKFEKHSILKKTKTKTKKQKKNVKKPQQNTALQTDLRKTED